MPSKHSLPKARALVLVQQTGSRGIGRTLRGRGSDAGCATLGLFGPLPREREFELNQAMQTICSGAGHASQLRERSSLRSV